MRAHLRSLEPRPPCDLATLYPGAERAALDLLSRLLAMNPRKRSTVEDALAHPYLASIRSPEEETVHGEELALPFDTPGRRSQELRQLIVGEIRHFQPEAYAAAAFGSGSSAGGAKVGEDGNGDGDGDAGPPGKKAKA